MVQSEVDASLNDASTTEFLDRAIGRRTKFLQEQFDMIESAEHYQEIISKTNEKKLILRFLRSPTELIGDGTRIKGVTLQKMRL